MVSPPPRAARGKRGPREKSSVRATKKPQMLEREREKERGLCFLPFFARAPGPLEGLEPEQPETEKCVMRVGGRWMRSRLCGYTGGDESFEDGVLERWLIRLGIRESEVLRVRVTS